MDKHNVLDVLSSSLCEKLRIHTIMFGLFSY